MVWRILALVLVVGITIMVEVPRLFSQEKRREVIAFGIILALAVTFGVVYLIGVKLPTPFDWLTAVFEPISVWIYGPAK